MDDGILTFQKMMEECLCLLKQMNSSQQKTLGLFWKDISTKFDALFSLYNGEQEMQQKEETKNEEIPKIPEQITDTWQPTCNDEVCQEESENTTGSSIKILEETASEPIIETFAAESKVNVKSKTPKIIKAKKNDVCNQPRRSNRRVKPSSLYNDFITTPVTYVKDFDEENNVSHEGTVTVDSITGLLQEGDKNTPEDSEEGRTITFKTLNSFPESMDVASTHALSNETVFQLHLSTKASSSHTEDGDQTEKPLHADHVYSNLSSQDDPQNQVQILVTVLNSDELHSQGPPSEHHYEDHTDTDQAFGDEMETEDQPQSDDSSPLAESQVLFIDQEDQPLDSTSSPNEEPAQKPGKSLLTVKKNSEGFYDCPDCGKRIANYSNMKVHMRIHSGEKPYSCRVCGKAFSTITNMTRHERTTHEKEKRWQCDQCQKRFTEKKSLVIHKRIHSGERPYVCHVCCQAFAQAGTLKTHLHRHLGIKGHLCDFCGKSFRQKSQLCMHQLRHSNTRNFKCTVCPKAFVSKAELSRHQMSHSGERPFLCSHCPRTFTRLQYLKEHTNYHTNTTPYHCKFCGQAFRDLASHAKHVKRHALDSGMTESALQGKETYIVLPNSDFLMQEIETIKSPAEGGAQVLQVPTVVSEECVEQQGEGTEVALDISHLALAMQGSAMEGMVEVAQVQEDAGHTYITDPGGEAASNNQVAIQVHSVGADTQLDPGEQYIVIQQLDMQEDGEQVLQQGEDFENVHVVEVTSQET